MPDERRRNRSTIGQRSVHQKFSSSFRDTVYQRVDHSLGRRVLSSHLLKTRTSSRPFQPSAIRHGIDVSQRNSCPLLFCPLTPNSHRGDPTETRQSGDANKKNTRGGCFFFFSRFVVDVVVVGCSADYLVHGSATDPPPLPTDDSSIAVRTVGERGPFTGRWWTINRVNPSSATL